MTEMAELQEVREIDELLQQSYDEAARLNTIISILQTRRIEILKSTIRVVED